MIRDYFSSSSSFQKAPAVTVGSRAGYAMDSIISGDRLDFRKLNDKKLLYILYRRDPLSNKVVNATANFTVSRGFKIIPPSDKARAVIKDFLYKMHRTDPINALLVDLTTLTKDAGWSGDGWRERRYSQAWTQNENPFNVKNNSIIGLKPIHPLTMDFKRGINGEILLDEDGLFGEKGEFLSYTQKLEDAYQKRDIDKRRIAHLKFNYVGDEQLGISDLEIIYKTRHRGMNIEDG